MMFTASAAAILASALLGGANAHMYMQEPKPYNAAKVSTSPLGSANGLPFPCQGAIDTTTPATAAQAGGAIKVKFGGSAVHGGGTCQFSVTYENPPPADPSKWKVLQTIVGGCPSSAPANLQQAGEDADGRPAGKQCAEGDHGIDCLATFNVPISKEIKNGKATFAWTWFNKVGNREMYMNCAPIEITGGKDDDSGMADLPSMFMANVDSKPCTTKEAVLDLKKVGGNVVVLQDATEASLGTCPIPNGPLPEGGVGGGNGNADTSNPIPDESAPPAAVPSPVNPGNQLAETPAPAPADPAPATPSQPETPVVAPSQPVAPAPPTGDGVPCPAGTQDGAIFCISTTQWATCNWGTGVPMAVAGGLQCVGNNPNTPIPARKRHVRRHLRPHARSFL